MHDTISIVIINYSPPCVNVCQTVVVSKLRHVFPYGFIGIFIRICVRCKNLAFCTHITNKLPICHLLLIFIHSSSLVEYTRKVLNTYTANSSILILPGTVYLERIKKKKRQGFPA